MPQVLCVLFPIFCVNFVFIPIRLRVPFIDLCGLGWIVLLSVTRGEKEANDDEIKLVNP